jgi:RsiW-degrading membrane proteinase PrsW (M82 family)
MDNSVFLPKRNHIMLINFFLYHLLLILSIIPVGLLMFFIYHQDKYQKEPLGSLMKAFFGGMLAIVFTLITVSILDYTIGLIPILSETVFYASFITAGIPEELCKFLIFMIFIWNDKNFDEYFDGIVYASFISLGFACVENIMYVFSSGAAGIGVAIVRSLLSVPGHFLFGIILGYFLSLAKFHSSKRGLYIFLGLLIAATAHGLFDWLLMIADVLENGYVAAIVYLFFIGGDIMLWFLGMKLMKKLQIKSFQQAQENAALAQQEYQRIDWNAGNRQ